MNVLIAFKSGHKLAFLIILRACTEFFLEQEIKNKDSKYKDSKEHKIDIFINEITTNETYKILEPKTEEIKKLFDIYRIQGDHIAHCRVDEAKRFIEDYCLESILKLFCIILENSIFIEDILKINEDLKLKKLKSIDFNPQKIENKNNKQPIEETSNTNQDDEIPF